MATAYPLFLVSWLKDSMASNERNLPPAIKTGFVALFKKSAVCLTAAFSDASSYLIDRLIF